MDRKEALQREHEARTGRVRSGETPLPAVRTRGYRRIMWSVLLLLIAIISKIIGCGFGARMCRYSKEESLQIGVGMISRGEVALIVANKGMALGLMSSVFFGPVIIVVIATTIITPILLKIVFSREKHIAEPMIESPLVAEFNEAEKLEMMEQKISEAADGIVCTPNQEKTKD